MLQIIMALRSSAVVQQKLIVLTDNNMQWRAGPAAAPRPRGGEN